jgi:formate dehydrogenase maturation protein FdhE
VKNTREWVDKLTFDMAHGDWLEKLTADVEGIRDEMREECIEAVKKGIGPNPLVVHRGEGQYVANLPDIYIEAAVKALGTVGKPHHKACPFCGGMPEVHQGMHVSDQGRAMGKVYIACAKCLAMTTWFESQVKAWAAWDRRKEDR